MQSAQLRRNKRYTPRAASCRLPKTFRLPTCINAPRSSRRAACHGGCWPWRQCATEPSCEAAARLPGMVRQSLRALRGLLTASLSGIGSKASWPSMVLPARRPSSPPPETMLGDVAGGQARPPEAPARRRFPQRLHHGPRQATPRSRLCRRQRRPRLLCRRHHRCMRPRDP